MSCTLLEFREDRMVELMSYHSSSSPLFYNLVLWLGWWDVFVSSTCIGYTKKPTERSKRVAECSSANSGSLLDDTRRGYTVNASKWYPFLLQQFFPAVVFPNLRGLPGAINNTGVSSVGLSCLLRWDSFHHVHEVRFQWKFSPLQNQSWVD